MRGLLQNVTGRDAIPKARVLWTAVNHLPERIRNVMEEPQEDEKASGRGGPPDKDGCRSRYFAHQRPRKLYELLLFSGLVGGMLWNVMERMK